MIDWKRIGIETEIDLSDLSDKSYFGQDHINNAVHRMKMELAMDFVNRMQLDKTYLVKLSSYYTFDPGRFSQKARFILSFNEVPEQEIQFIRQYKYVTVDALEIESINCHNCAAPIPVGKLDLRGDTLVRCSYCGTYHKINQKET